MVGIVAYGGYIPRLRLSRKAIATAHAWANPGIMGQGRGERAMGNWDEDSLTMAVEACRDCLRDLPREEIDALYLASTSLPFADRQNSGIVAAALALREAVPAADITSSQKAGTSALLQALNAAAAGTAAAPLIVASDKRRAKAASSQEMQYGDGAAALLLGPGGGIARFLGSHSLTIDFVDHFRGEGQDFDYAWEERWIRDEGYSKIVPRAIEGLLAKTGVRPEEIDHFILPCVFPRLDATVAKSCGIDPDRTRDNLQAVCGDTGSAHALVMLVHALQEAEPGQKILLAAFGQGCDALLFETTEAVQSLNARSGIIGALARRREETNYIKYLTFNGLIEWEKGMRAERDNKTALTVLYRKHDMILGLVGGRCEKCGTAQFPRGRICVNPNCHAVDSQEPYDFAEKKARVLSWSADYLTFSMSPPQHYGMITFEEGGRFMADFTDVDPGEVDSGMEMRMAFRIKDFDERRGFRRYFWKAVPVESNA